MCLRRPGYSCNPRKIAINSPNYYVCHGPHHLEHLLTGYRLYTDISPVTVGNGPQIAEGSGLAKKIAAVI